jgi:hypothetical protein
VILSADWSQSGHTRSITEGLCLLSLITELFGITARPTAIRLAEVTTGKEHGQTNLTFCWINDTPRREDVWGSRGMGAGPPCFTSPVGGGEESASFSSRFASGVRALGNHYRELWASPRTGLHVVYLKVCSSFREQNSGHQSRSLLLNDWAVPACNQEGNASLMSK